jgi:hypothetical protein
LVLGIVFACAGGERPTGGETHFLTWCNQDSGGCAEGLACVCGVCTQQCALRMECQRFPGAECTTSASEICGESPRGRCDVACRIDTDCADVSSSHRCRAGFCRAGIEPQPAGAGAGGTAGASSGGASQGGDAGAGGSCTAGGVDGNSVLLIGDSFFAQSHAITAELEGLARSSGALQSGQRYQDQSSMLDNALALNSNGILGQYTRGKAEASVRVVIMNGGGADLLLGSCDAPYESCPVITNAAAAARDLFAHMAIDGVSNVLYAFYPNPVDATLAQKIDAFRPLAQRACSESSVPCHFVDLRTSFAGHYDEYVLSDGINPTAAGARASAAAIWEAMRAYCIAQ